MCGTKRNVLRTLCHLKSPHCCIFFKFLAVNNSNTATVRTYNVGGRVLKFDVVIVIQEARNLNYISCVEYKTHRTVAPQNA
jgi:hypothetical protein